MMMEKNKEKTNDTKKNSEEDKKRFRFSNSQKMYEDKQEMV
jgi:hypothetical protein